MTQNAVANIMSQVNLQEQEPTSMWGKFKNFAGSDGGRMLLGGLGTALAVGLSGGDTKKALAYGLQGAGNVANNIYQREERAKKRYDDAMQTALQWQNQVANRELQKTLQTDRIKAQQDLAQTNYDNALDLLTQKATVEEQSKKRQREAEDAYYNDLYVKAGLTPEQITYANLQRKGINPSDMTSQMAYNTLYNPNATPEQKELAREQLVNIANVNKEIKDISKSSLTLDDVIGFGKDAGLSVTPESFNNAIDSGNYNDLVFERKQKGLTGDAALIEFLRDNGKSFEESLAIVGRLTPEQKNQAEISLAQGKSNIKVGEHQQISDIDTNAYGTKAGIDFGYQQQGADAELGRKKDFANFEYGLGEQKADNALVRDQEMADYNSKIKQIEDAYKAELAKAEAEHKAYLDEQAKQKAYEREVELLNFKQTLPSQHQKEIAEMSIALGIPEKDIYEQMYNKMKKEGVISGGLTPSQIATGVGNGTISPEKANELVGQDIFQISTKKKEAEEKALKQRQEQIANIQAVDKQLDEFEALFKDVPQSKVESYTKGFWRDITGTLTPKEAEFESKRTLLYNKIARDLGGEKGVLSDQDIKRVEKALPTIYDNPLQRASKMAAIRDLVQIRLKQINGDIPLDEEETPDVKTENNGGGFKIVGVR